MTLGKGNVGGHLSPQGAVAERLQPLLQGMKLVLLVEAGKLLSEAFKVAKGAIVNETDQTVEFEQRVL